VVLVPLTTLKRLVHESTRDQVRRALEDNGIVFLVSDQGEGVMFVRRDAQARPNGRDSRRAGNLTKWRVRRGSIAQTAFAIDGRRLRDADLPSTKSPGTAVRIATLIVQKTTRKVVTIPPFEDRPPELDRVGPYDHKHLASYLRLLDAEAEGADWREAVAVIFGLDPEKEPKRAKLVHDSHLARAHWMTEKGYRHLLEPRMQ